MGMGTRAGIAHAPLVENRKSPEGRKELLAGAVAVEVQRDAARTRSQSDYQAVMIKGSRTNHVLHLILWLVTLGLWVLAWVAVAAFGGHPQI
jgi:hypothetical protein